MIATNILVLECDGCGHKDIFTAVPDGSYNDGIRPKLEDLAREEWTEAMKYSSKLQKYVMHHFCKGCYGKAAKA